MEERVSFSGVGLRALVKIAGWIGEAFELWLATLCPPGARELSAAQARIGRAGGKPRYVVTERGGLFTARTFTRYLGRRGIGHRYGAVGTHGSIALVERIWRTLKGELMDGVFVFLPLAVFRRDKPTG